MTEFIESFATDQQLIPPLRSPDVASWLFVLELGDDGGVGRFLDYFNGTHDEGLAPAPFVYQPLPGRQYAFLTVAAHAGVASFAHDRGFKFGSRDAGWNRVSCLQVSLAIPVIRQPGASDTDIVWLQPFNWYDSASMVFSAREIWGAEAEFMRIEREIGLEAPALHLDTAYVGVEVFSPYAFNELLAALHVKVGAHAPPDPATLPGWDLQLADLLSRLMGLGANAGGAPAGAAHSEGAIEIDSLKQFRSAEDMGLAIYRALVASEQRHAAPRDVAFHDLAEVEVDFMWSAGMSQLLVDFLGLTPPPGCGPLPIMFDDWAPSPKPPACGCGPPPPHRPVHPPPPAQPGDAPVHVRWDLYRLPAKPVLCLSYRTDLSFHVLGTPYVYRLA